MHHFNKQLFNTLEIKTSDNKSIYVPREFVASLSPYFEALLSNGCKESYEDSCYLDYELKIISVIISAVNESYRGTDYVSENHFTKLCTSEDINNFVSALTEYQLDHILHVFDKYLSRQKLDTYMSSDLFNTVCRFKLTKTRDNFIAFLKDNKYFLKFLDYSKVDFEFTELYFDMGSLEHLKIFTLWAVVHRPTDNQLVESRLLKHNFNHLNASKLSKIVIRLSGALENAPNFKCSLYEKILCDTFNSLKLKSKHKEKNHYKQFIEQEMRTQMYDNPYIDIFVLIAQIIKKWKDNKANK